MRLKRILPLIRSVVCIHPPPFRPETAPPGAFQYNKLPCLREKLQSLQNFTHVQSETTRGEKKAQNTV